ncbi:unnamed protein product, partial [Porites evermanni]
KFEVKISAVSEHLLKYLNHIMVQLERRRGLLFSVIILGAIVSGSVYYYVRDYWNIEAKEARVVELEKLIKDKQARVKALQESIDGKK